ncbi:MAG: nucleotidyltransferase family protein, partial [Terracidiphilus sp.]
ERNVFHCLANAAELIHLLNTFDIAGIPILPYKGIVLAASVYNDLAARPAGDLDLLIHSKHLAQATALLLERGYRQIGSFQADGIPIAFDNHEYVFERPSDGLVVELRWKLDFIYGRFRRNLDMDWACANRRTAVVAGFEVPDMAPETTLLVLCMHGSKHVWSRLIWVCDVAQLIASSPQLDWQLTMRVARQSGLWRALALGTLLAHRVAGARVPGDVLRRLRTVASACRLAEHFEQHLLDQPGIGPVGLVPYNIQMLDFSDRFSPRLWLGFLRPNDRDRAAFPLPKSLRALHYLLRPFRLLFSQPQK